MHSIGSKQYYVNLLYEESFNNFLNEVIHTEKDPTLARVAKELLFASTGNKIITYRPYYDGFYKKYKILLRNTKSTEGFKISIHSLSGQNQQYLGKMSSVTNPLPLPPALNTPDVTAITEITDTTLKNDLKIISPVNNVKVNAKSKSAKPKPINLDLPNPFVGPIAGWPLITSTTMDTIKSNANKIGDFADWYPRTSKVYYTIGEVNAGRSTLDNFFNNIYELIYFPLIWIKPYTLSVFSGYEGKPNQGSDIKEEFDKIGTSFPYQNENKSKWWNWSTTDGGARTYSDFKLGMDWWNIEYDVPDDPTGLIVLKQRDFPTVFPNSEVLVKPEPCDQTVIRPFVSQIGDILPLNCVQNSFLDLLRRYLPVRPPHKLNPDYPISSGNKILYDYDKVPEWAIPNWSINNDCAKKVKYYEYQLRDNHKLVDSIRVTGDPEVYPDIESITIKDLPGLTHFEVTNCAKLTSINLSGANNLTTIDISDCPKLTSIVGIAGKRYLKDCRITSTRITSIDVSNCQILEILKLNNNSLTRISLNGCNALGLAEFNRNELTSLDISNNTQLRILDVGNNFLTGIDISNNNQLEFIDLAFNKLTESSVDNILQKFVEFTDSKTLGRRNWDEGYIYLHGGFNARPSYGNLNSPNMGMGYYIDLIEPDFLSSQTEYDSGASRITDELTGYLETLHTDKVNYAKLKKDVISSPYYDPVYAALTSINGPIKTWRRTNNNDEIVPLYKKWIVTINRNDVPLIIFRTYEQ